MKARVLGVTLNRCQLDIFSYGKACATIRGNIKKNTNILVGDIVDVSIFNDEYIIEKVYPRKNSLVRPPVSNIDVLVIVVAISNPEPDYLLLDKEILVALKHNIKPVICINKIDLVDNNSVDLKYINDVYKKLGIDVVYTSAILNKGISDLKQCIVGKVAAFSGNSGVGKSSITKSFINDECIEIGDIGKLSKGKHTTKYVKLYDIGESTYILDTPGFSSYDIYDIEYKELKNLYSEFNCKCEYDDCMHVLESEDVCQVKRKVLNAEIDKGRYERYVYLYNNLKKIDKNKYK